MILIPFSKKNVYSPADSVPPVSHLISYNPTKSNFRKIFRNCHDRTCTIQTSYIPRIKLMAIFFSLDRLSKEHFQVRGSLWHYVTSSFLWRGVVSPTPNHSAREPPLVGCPPLLILYIRSYPPYLEDISSMRNLRTLLTTVKSSHLAWPFHTYFKT
jgi:hypothetical protein